MNPPIFFTSWTTLWYFHHLAASKISTKKNLTDYKYPGLILNLPHELYGTACPASTEREMKFNEEVSISGKGLFLRNIHHKNETLLTDICDKPIEPVMLYNLQNRTYEIGYELYYQQGKIQLVESIYSRFRPIGKNNEIGNRTKSLSQNVVECEKGNSTKFHFTDGSPELIFHWASKLSFEYSAHTKQTMIAAKNIPSKRNSPIKCPSHGLNEQDMRVYLSSNDDENSYELWKDHRSYGVLELSQIIPVRFFSQSSEILAACSHMNVVPIWKSIVDGQLKKVDLYLQAVIKAINRNILYEGGIIWHIDNVSFGVSDVLEEPITKKKMYFFDTEHRRQIAIPKIIYRMIEGIQNRGVFNAIIVIHNDPTTVSDSDRICAEEDEVPGWENIKNDDPRTGLTYVCHYHLKKISPSDKFKLNSEDLLSRPLRLDEVPRFMLMGSWEVEFWDMDIKDTIKDDIREIEDKSF